MIFEKLFCSQTWMYLKLARILLTTCCSNLALFNAHFFPSKKRPISILDIFSNNQKMVDPRILTCKKYILANPPKTLAEKESGIELYTRNMLQTGKKLQWINGCLPQIFSLDVLLQVRRVLGYQTPWKKHLQSWEFVNRHHYGNRLPMTIELTEWITGWKRISSSYGWRSKP